MSTHEQVLELKTLMSRDIIGQEAVVERLLLALLANGNVLMEGLPGLAKTRAIKSMANNLEADFSRIQFTPDLLPADVTGSEMYYEKAGQGTFKFQPGPIFGNLVLADEINRAPAKVQAALLQAMEEREVTVAGTTHKLPPLFLVMATQNPIEQEGTYPLPEAQMDRFLMKVLIEYPDTASEKQVIALVRGEQAAASKKNHEVHAKIAKEVIFAAREEIDGVHSSDAIEDYIVALIEATRYPDRYSEELANLIQVGASPRGSLALDRCSRAYAWLAGRDHVTPDDVRAIVPDCLRHRISLSYEAEAEGTSADHVLAELVKQVAVA